MRRFAFLFIPVALACGLLAVFWTVPSATELTEGKEPPKGQAAPLHPALQRALEGAGSSDLLPVILTWRRDESVYERAIQTNDLQARRQYLVATLQDEAQRQTAPLLDFIDLAQAQGLASEVRSFWVSPVMAFSATPEVIDALRYYDQVVQIRLDEPMTLEETPVQTVPAADPQGYPFNLEMIDVDLARGALGLDGSGVVVAVLDTGVDWQHPALMEKYRGYNPHGGPAVHVGNWHVSTNEPYVYPGDGNGHGTHVTGIILGGDEDDPIGVAPGARWIAVKIFTNGGLTYESWVHDAFQWVVAPDGNPNLAPDIVNNSWGGLPSTDARFRPDIATLRAAGILPVFSAGNDGPGSKTIGHPGSYPESLAVGAVDAQKMVTHFSSRGPSPWEEVKPDLVAPGVAIRSTFPGGGYATFNGTSMAAPHVSGVLALLLGAESEYSPSQLEDILTSKAVPLQEVVPNNASGWGLVNAYAAGLQVTESGELVGEVARSGGAPVFQPTVVAEERGSDRRVTVKGDVDGAFRIALQPGLYDITAVAFGLNPKTLYGLRVLTGTKTQADFRLVPLQVGTVSGKVTEVETGAPLSATLIVEDTPLQVKSLPENGDFSIVLPEGTWSIRIIADAHRIGTLNVQVTPGIGLYYDVHLSKVPRILLVDSGAWYYESQISYYEDALEALAYPYHLWSICDPFGQWDDVGDLPTTSTLSGYDVVIWSTPLGAPGMIGAHDVISSYLAGGGHMILSGQDIAFWDGGGQVINPWRPYLVKQIGVWFGDEGDLMDLVGVPGGWMEGMRLTFNTADSAGQQFHPDLLRIIDPLYTDSIFRQSADVVNAVTAGRCQPYQVALLGFGFEGVGPFDERIETLRRLLDWLALKPPPYDLLVSSSSEPLVGAAGAVVSHTFRLENIGAKAETFDILVTGGLWELELTVPESLEQHGESTITLDSCSGANITATISIPPDLPRDTYSIYDLNFVSQHNPLIQDVVTLTVKTPAPVLFVDDERWYHHEESYFQSFEELGYSYDVFNTRSSLRTPLTDTLNLYPIVVWATGYDWYSPLTDEEVTQLDDYLESGGSLLLSSQDVLDTNGLNDFVRNRLGVNAVFWTVTSTQVIASPEGPWGTDQRLWKLTFPFENWSDGIVPGEDAYALLVDEHLYTVGAIHPGDGWRTAFFPFPLETLSEDARRILLERTLLRLSVLGESQLEAPATVREGSQFPVKLTLGLGTPESQSGLRALLALPDEVGYVEGNARGSWEYDAGAHALFWSGDLTPEANLPLIASLEMVTGVPDGTVIPLVAQLYAGDGLTVTASAPLRVDAPWINLATQVHPAETGIDGMVRISTTVENIGVVSATVELIDILPNGLEMVPGTADAKHGSFVAEPQRLTWTGTLVPDESLEIGFSAIVTLPRAGTKLVNRVEAFENTDHFMVWAELSIPAKWFFPVVFR
jgi:uncharacterized repeat protein (TIGR01451 family)